MDAMKHRRAAEVRVPVTGDPVQPWRTAPPSHIRTVLLDQWSQLSAGGGGTVPLGGLLMVQCSAAASLWEHEQLSGAPGPVRSDVLLLESAVDALIRLTAPLWNPMAAHLFSDAVEVLASLPFASGYRKGIRTAVLGTLYSAEMTTLLRDRFDALSVARRSGVRSPEWYESVGRAHGIHTAVLLGYPEAVEG